jgi:hypothetical protein
MRKLHVVALSCFALAFLFYFASWLPGALGIGMLGIVFEVAGWVALLRAQNRKPTAVIPSQYPQAQTTEEPPHAPSAGPNQTP